jgi:hypothetical protein
MSLEDLTTKADFIFIGTCVEAHSAWNQEHTRIYTQYGFEISEYLKDDAGVYVTIETIGGIVGDVGLAVPGMPVFRVGERDLIFVSTGKRSGTNRVLAWAQGRFVITIDPQTGQEVLHRPLSGMTLVGTSDLIQKPLRYLSDLKTAVHQILKGSQRRRRG